MKPSNVTAFHFHFAKILFKTEKYKSPTVARVYGQIGAQHITCPFAKPRCPETNPRRVYACNSVAS
jgi:hypothetical protein